MPRTTAASKPVVGVQSRNFLLEIKAGPNRLNAAQVLFHAEWRGQCAVERATAEALQAIGLWTIT